MLAIQMIPLMMKIDIKVNDTYYYQTKFEMPTLVYLPNTSLSCYYRNDYYLFSIASSAISRVSKINQKKSEVDFKLLLLKMYLIITVTFFFHFFFPL